MHVHEFEVLDLAVLVLKGTRAGMKRIINTYTYIYIYNWKITLKQIIFIAVENKFL